MTVRLSASLEHLIEALAELPALSPVQERAIKPTQIKENAFFIFIIPIYM